MVTLLGVIAGGTLSSRATRQQWQRDKQIDACTVLVRESTRMQLELRQQWKRGGDIDWTAWNQALALMWLVGAVEVITMAHRMDRIFWLCSGRIRRGLTSDEKAWKTARDEMESARLDFINATRSVVVGARIRIQETPIARPSLAELDELFPTRPAHDIYHDEMPREGPDQA